MNQQSTPFQEFASVDQMPKRTYRLVFLRGDGSVFAAHSYAGLACVFVNGYADIDETDDQTRYAARADALNRYVLAMQFALLQGFAEYDPEGFERLTDEDMAYLEADKHEGGFIDFHHWPHEDLPLILFTTGYEPFVAEMDPPTGNIAWVDAVTDRSFVESLARIGFGKVLVNDSIGADPDAGSVPGQR